MERIIFDAVVPEVFAHQTDLHSEVWGTRRVFEKGKLYLVEAESGKGKSTFCSYILGYRRDYSGSICFDTRNVMTFKVADWIRVRQQQVSLLFQELRLFPELTAMENVEIKNKITAWKTREQIEAWFEQLGIADKMQVRLGHMSFGQQQRVALMRSLVQPFDFLFVDEPISHLDERNAAIVADMMMSEAKAQGAGVIVTSIGKHMALPYDEVVKL